MKSCSISIGHPPHSSARPVELRLQVGPRTLRKKNYFTASELSMPAHVLLVYRCMCKSRDNDLSGKKQPRDHVVSSTKKLEDKQKDRAWPQHNMETSDVAGDGR